MKRSWIGFALLVVLAVLGLLVTRLMAHIDEPVAQDLEQSAECVALGDWENGDRFFAHAYESWETWAHVRTCFADHNPTEEIDSLFAQLQVYAAAREDAAFSAGCMELARKVAAMGEAHEVSWWNVF